MYLKAGFDFFDLAEALATGFFFGGAGFAAGFATAGFAAGGLVAAGLAAAGAATGGFATTGLCTADFVAAAGVVAAGIGAVAGFGGSAANTDPVAIDTNATSSNGNAVLRMEINMEFREWGGRSGQNGRNLITQRRGNPEGNLRCY